MLSTLSSIKYFKPAVMFGCNLIWFDNKFSTADKISFLSLMYFFDPLENL